MTSPRSWTPFVLCESGKRPNAPRLLHTVEGIGDRLRAAAFAEIQAREAFLWAASFYPDAPEDLRIAWRELAAQEDKHLGWLLARLQALGISIQERPVSDLLWHSLMSCPSAQEFARFMAGAEERGRRAGERFCKELASIDPVTSQIFGKIAEEEVEHIRLAERFFPQINNR